MSGQGGIEARIRTNNLDNIQNADLKNILNSDSYGKLVKGDSGLEVKSGVFGFLSKVAGFFGFKSEENKTAKQEFLKGLEREFNLSPDSTNIISKMIRPSDSAPLTVIEAKSIIAAAGLWGLYDETRSERQAADKELPKTNTDSFKQAVEKQVENKLGVDDQLPPDTGPLPPDTGPLPPMEPDYKAFPESVKNHGIGDDPFADHLFFKEDVAERRQGIIDDKKKVASEEARKVREEFNNFINQETNFFDDIEETDAKEEPPEPETMDKLNETTSKHYENVKATNNRILEKFGLKKPASDN